MDASRSLSSAALGVQSGSYVNGPLSSYVTCHQKIEADFSSELTKIRHLLERLPGIDSRFQLLSQLLGRIPETTPEVVEEWQTLLRKMGEMASEKCKLNLPQLNAYVTHEFPTWQKRVEGTSKRAHFVAMCQAFMSDEALKHRRTFEDLRDAEAKVKQGFERLERLREEIAVKIGYKRKLFQSLGKIESLEVPLSVSPHPQKDEFDVMKKAWDDGQAALANIQEQLYKLQKWLVAESEKRASAKDYTQNGLSVQLGFMGPAADLKKYIARCQELLTSLQEAARLQTLQSWGKVDGESKRWGEAVAFEERARMQVTLVQLELIKAPYDLAFNQAERMFNSMRESDRSLTSSPSLGSSVLSSPLTARVRPPMLGATLCSWIYQSVFGATQKKSPSINWEGLPKTAGYPDLYQFNWASEEAWKGAKPTAPVIFPAEEKGWEAIHYWADLVGSKREQVFRNPDASFLTTVFCLNLQGRMIEALKKPREPALQSAFDRLVLQHKRACEAFNPPPSTEAKDPLTTTLTILKDTVGRTAQTLNVKQPNDFQILTEGLSQMKTACARFHFWNTLLRSIKTQIATALTTKAKAAILSPLQVSDIALVGVPEEPPLGHFSDVLAHLKQKGDNALDTPEGLREFQKLTEALEKQKLSRFDKGFLAVSQHLDSLINEAVQLTAHIEQWKTLAEMACSAYKEQPYGADGDRDSLYERLAIAHLKFTTYMLAALPFILEVQTYCKDEAEKFECKRTEEKQNWRRVQIEWLMHTETGVRKREHQIDQALAKYRLTHDQLEFLIKEMRAKYGAGFASLQELFLLNKNTRSLSLQFAEHFFDISLPERLKILAATKALPVYPPAVMAVDPKGDGGIDPSAGSAHVNPDDGQDPAVDFVHVPQ